MNELVFIDGQQVVTDSLTIAEMFEKEHKHVLRDIKTQSEYAGEEFSQSNFGLSNYESRGKQYPKYNLTEEAFTLVVFSYNTKEAVQTKIKFIQEFKRMREFIEKQNKPNSLELMLEAALKHEREISTIKEDVSMLKDTMRIDTLQQMQIKDTSNQRVLTALGGKKSNAYCIKSIRTKAYTELWREFKGHYGLPRYGDLPKSKFEEALRFISLWNTSAPLTMEIQNANQQQQLF